MKNFAAIPKEQFQQDQTRSKNRFFDQDVVKELTSVARIFDWGGANHKSHAMTSSNFFERGIFVGKHRRMEDLKPWHGLALDQDFTK